MTAPNLARQKAGWATLDQVFKDSANSWVVHYSCESFYERPEGRSPRITSIAVRKLDSGQTTSFSIHQIAERQHIEFFKIEDHYDDLERKMLDRFYELIASHRGMRYLHWNMRDVNYGFAALDHRYAILGGTPITIGDEKKIDIARLLIDIYGKGYIDHPRLEKLIAMNHIKPLDFMTGKQEADAFESRNFVGLHQSTLRKVDILANLATLAHERSLETRTTWWEMHGGHFHSVFNWVAENKTIALIASVASIVGLYLTVWPSRH